MKQTRISQILHVLLFPYGDPKFQQNDRILERYMAYKDFISMDMNDIAMIAEREERDVRYQCRNQELIQYLAEKSEGNIKSYDDIFMLCELYFPIVELERRIRQIQEQKKQRGNFSDESENISLFYLNNLVQISLSLLTYRDGIAAIRTWNNYGEGIEKDIFNVKHVFDKVEIWNMIVRFMAPDILIAIFAVESGLDESALYEQKPHISLADKLLVKCLRRGLAENHLHFSAGFDYETLWLDYVNIFGCLDEEKERLSVIIFRYLAAVYFQSAAWKSTLFFTWVSGWKEGIFAPFVSNLYYGTKIPENTDDIKEVQEEFEGIFNEKILWNRTDYLLETVYSSFLELKTSSEFILLFQSYRYIKEHYWDTGFSTIFLQYLRLKNAFFQEKQQYRLTPGLRHFQIFFRNATMEKKRLVGRKGLQLDVFRGQAQITCLKKLEIRIAPNVEKSMLDCFDYEKCKEFIYRQLKDQLRDVFYAYRHYILESVLGVQKASEYLEREHEQRVDSDFSYCMLQRLVCENRMDVVVETHVPTIGIVYHFIKTDSLDNVSGYFCWRKINDMAARGSSHKLFLRQGMVNMVRAIEELRSSIPKLNEYIVGLDAASDENAMEPWMFAPAYNRMRSKKTTKPIIIERKGYETIQNIGFTYHVGEDFRHIVSGLRHIDEVVEEFHYKPGDRLGHAIALGLNIPKWVRENEVVPMPILEYMENLLWIWGSNVTGEVNSSIQLEMLEDKIMECAREIYGESLNGITVRMLYKAYKKKFLYNHKNVLEKLCAEPVCQSGKAQIHCRYNMEECNTYQALWTEERLLSTNYCPVFEERGQKICLVSVQEHEIEVFELLQEYLLQKIAKRGIYVETNPTSNVTIGEIDEVSEHPIFRLNSLKNTELKEHHILVTVNSDDPVVFNTNVENELAYIYYALEHAGYDKEDILSWIDKVRQNGMDASFIRKEKSTRVLLEEISGILDELEKY